MGNKHIHKSIYIICHLSIYLSIYHLSIYHLSIIYYLLSIIYYLCIYLSIIYHHLSTIFIIIIIIIILWPQKTHNVKHTSVYILLAGFLRQSWLSCCTGRKDQSFFLFFLPDSIVHLLLSKHIFFLWQGWCYVCAILLWYLYLPCFTYRLILNVEN